MMDWIRNLFSRYANGMYLPDIHIKDVVEILIITVIVYEIMLWIKNTKAWMLLRWNYHAGLFILLAMGFPDAYNLISCGAVYQCSCNGSSCCVSAGTAGVPWKSLEKKIFSAISTFLTEARIISAFLMQQQTGLCAPALKWAVSVPER